jgi:hypothetical protein
MMANIYIHLLLNKQSVFIKVIHILVTTITKTSVLLRLLYSCIVLLENNDHLLISVEY